MEANYEYEVPGLSHALTEYSIEMEQNEKSPTVTDLKERMLLLEAENRSLKQRNEELMKRTVEYSEMKRQHESLTNDNQRLKHALVQANREIKALEQKLMESEACTQGLLFERSEIASSQSIISELRNEIEELLTEIASMQQDFSMYYLDFKTLANQNKRLIIQLQESLHKARKQNLKLVSVLDSRGQVANTDPRIANTIAESQDTENLRKQNLRLQTEVNFFKNEAKDHEIKNRKLHSRLLDSNARLVQVNSILKQSTRLHNFEKQRESRRPMVNTNETNANANEIIQKSEDLPKRNSYLSSTSYGYHSAADSGEVRSHERLSQDLHSLYEHSGCDLSESSNEDFGHVSREYMQLCNINRKSNGSSNNSATTMVASHQPRDYLNSANHYYTHREAVLAGNESTSSSSTIVQGSYNPHRTS